MNRRGFFGLLGKLAAVGVAMGVSPKLLTVAAPSPAIYRGANHGWPGLGVGFCDWTGKLYTKEQLDAIITASPCYPRNLGEPTLKYYDSGKPDFALAS